MREQIEKFTQGCQSLGLYIEDFIDLNAEQAILKINQTYRSIAFSSHSDKSNAKSDMDFDALKKARDDLLNIAKDKKIFDHLKKRLIKREDQGSIIEEESFDAVAKRDLVTTAKNPEEAQMDFDTGQERKKNNPKYAITCFKRAIDNDGTCIRYAIALGELLYEEKAYEEARGVLLTAQEQSKDPTDWETAKLYYLLAVLSTQLEDGKSYTFIKSAQNLDKQGMAFTDLTPSAKNTLQQLEEKYSKRDNLTTFIEAETKNSYYNEKPLPNNLEEQFSRGIQAFIETGVLSLSGEEETEEPQVHSREFRDDTTKNQPLVLAQQSQIVRATDSCASLIHYVDEQLYQAQIQALSQDAGLQNMQALREKLKEEEEILDLKKKNVKGGFDQVKLVYYTEPKNTIQKTCIDGETGVRDVLGFGTFPFLIMLAPFLVPYGLVVGGLLGLGKRSIINIQIKRLRHQKQKVNAFVEQLQTSTKEIVAFIKILQPILHFGTEHVEWLEKSKEVDQIILETEKQFREIEKLFKSFGAYELSLVLHVRWGDYHLWLKDLFIKAAEYYQDKNVEKAQQLGGSSKKHIDAAKENFEKAIDLIAKRDKRQLISPLMLIYLVGTLLEYWHYCYHEESKNAILNKEARLRSYRQFISDRLQNLNLGLYLGESQALLSWLPYFNSPYIDRKNYLETFKIICGHLKPPTIYTSESRRTEKKSFVTPELFSVMLPNEEKKIYLTEEVVVGDGDCGFHTMGITREQLVSTLLSLKEDQGSRVFLSHEILNEFRLRIRTQQTSSFPQQKEWKKLLDKADALEEERNKAVARTRRENNLPKETKKLDPAELTNYLRQHIAQYPEAFVELNKLNQKVLAADQALLDFCQQSHAYEYYVKQYLGTMWLGCYSALLYAKKQHISLYIWEKSDATKKLILKYSTETDDESSDTIHMLFTGSCTHFNLLVEIEKDDKNVLDQQIVIRDYQSLLQLFPHSSNLHNNLGAVYEKQGRLKKAREHYQRAMELDPENPIPLANLSRLSMEEKDYPRAANGFETMYDLHCFREQCPELASIQSSQGKSPAKEALDVEEVTLLKKEEHDTKEEYDSESTIRKNGTSDKKYKILSIDGGGIRGIIPGRVLADIEKEVIEAIEPVKSLASCFDLLAGTSIGGIICLGLASPSHDRKTAQELVTVYSDRSSEIFTPSPWAKAKRLITYKYKPDGLEVILKECLGTSTMGEALTEVIVPTYCLNDNHPYFIDSSEDYKDWSMCKTARCTSAAPTFFLPAEVNGKRFIDGGVFANNPVMYACTRAMQNYSLSDLCVVSLGTGNYMQPLDACDQGILCQGGYSSYATKIFDIASNGISQTSHLQMQGLFATRGRYHRINVELTRKIPLDDTSSETISDLKSLGREAIEDNREALNEICQVLRM